MIHVFANAALVAAESPGPRGDNPGELSGILIIVGIVLAAVVLGLVAHLLVHRFGRGRPETALRRPHREGRVGRTSEFRSGRDG